MTRFLCEPCSVSEIGEGHFGGCEGLGCQCAEAQCVSERTHRISIPSKPEGVRSLMTLVFSEVTPRDLRTFYFGEALLHLHSGLRLRRTSWPVGTWIYKAHLTSVLTAFDGSPLTSSERDPVLVLRSQEEDRERCRGWTPEFSDLLSSDWMLANPLIDSEVVVDTIQSRAEAELYIEFREERAASSRDAEVYNTLYEELIEALRRDDFERVQEKARQISTLLNPESRPHRLFRELAMSVGRATTAPRNRGFVD